MSSPWPRSAARDTFEVGEDRSHYLSGEVVGLDDKLQRVIQHASLFATETQL